MEIKWLRKALQNLDDEARYIAQDNPFAATTVVQRIYDSVAILADNPAAGRSGRVPGTRELVVPDIPYIVPYRMNKVKNRIEILRVFHTSRKLPASW